MDPINPELIIGIVAPIGTDVALIAEQIESELSKLGYSSSIIHLSKLMEQPAFRSKVNDKDLEAIKYSFPNDQVPNYADKISLGNAFRAKGGDNILASLAVAEIARIRKDEFSMKHPGMEPGNQQLLSKAYIVRQLKRPEEISHLRSIYGRKFIQISVVSSYEHRLEVLTRKLSRDHADLKHPEEVAQTLIRIDEEQLGAPNGQQIRETAHTADVFIDGSSESRSEASLKRFFYAFFGNNKIGPTRDEFGCYMAMSASLRSVDLSRQVGSAIFTSEGDIVTVGCNEVPKFGGGNYWEDDFHKARDVDQDRESNKIEVNRIIHGFISDLIREGHISGVNTETFIKNASSVISKARVSDITEFGRMAHAEMNAICDAARLGRALAGTSLYVTTFPCHNCAKHIVASGIMRVVYIEPYAKSLAPSMQSDSISVDKSSCGKVKFEHFIGVAPRRFRDIFERGRRRDKANNIVVWAAGKPHPQVEDTTPHHIELEKSGMTPIDRLFFTPSSTPE